MLDWFSNWNLGIVIAVINTLGVLGSAFWAGKRAKKSEYINSVSASRQEWLEKVRNNFIEYNKIIYLGYRYSENPSIQSEDSFALNSAELRLLINPSDRFVQLLTLLDQSLQLEIRYGVVGNSANEDFLEEIINENLILNESETNKLKRLVMDKKFEKNKLYGLIGKVQQIILKREWEIVKKEVKDGGKISQKAEDHMAEIAIEKVDGENNEISDLIEFLELKNEKIN